MAEFKILRYLRKWYLPIAIASVLCWVAFNSYIDGQQTYTASAMISYVGTNADQGLTPSGAAIDVSQINSSNVIFNVIEDLGIRSSIDFIRSRTKIKEIIPDDEETRKQALLDKGEEYTYFPTSYIVSFTVDSDYSKEFARKVLDSILSNYFAYYCEKYVNVTVIPGGVNSDTIAGCDYIEQANQIDATLTEIINYLYARAEAYPLFWSTQVGYSFSNLLEKYKLLYDLNIDQLYSDIYDEALTADADALISVYQNRLDDFTLKKKSCTEKIAALKTVIEQYVAKIAEAQTNTVYDGVVGDNIIQAVHETNTHQDATYDELINKYVSYQSQQGQYEQDIQRCQRMLAIFRQAGQADKNTEPKRMSVEQHITEIAQQSKELYQLLITMVDEYNEYLSAKNVRADSSISVENGINTKLYSTIALVLFLILFSGGAVVLGRLAEIIQYYLFTDSKSGVPNRVSCDRKIDQLSKKPLDYDTSCVVIVLKNLNQVNDTIGFAEGDALLKNSGTIIKHCAEKYGFAGYNGGGYFICFFEGCTYEKALDFKNKLLKTVNNYNKQFPDVPMIVSCTIQEARRDGIYQARELLKKTIVAAGSAPAMNPEALQPAPPAQDTAKQSSKSALKDEKKKGK